MEFAFKIYEPKKRTRVKQLEPVIRVKTNGRIVFNKLATELLNKANYCLLASDSSNKAVGILPIAEKRENSFPIRYTGKGSYIPAKKFFKETGLLPGADVIQTPINAGEYVAVRL